MSRPPARIFIVDDHPLIREWLATLIEREPDLRICGHAADANAALEALPGSGADIVVVDLSLNRGSGLELIVELQARFPAVLVLVLTMHEETAWAERAFRAGARGYVLKRESGSCVVAALRAVRDGQFYASESLGQALAGRPGGAMTQPPDSPTGLLSGRERAVFELRGAGRTAKVIAEHLGVSIKTVESYEARIKQKLGLESGSALVREAVRWSERHPSA